MADVGTTVLAQAVSAHRDVILKDWLDLLRGGPSLRTGRLREAELVSQATGVLELFSQSLRSDPERGAHNEAAANLRSTLGDISRSRAIQGFTSTDTALFVLSLKEPVFKALAASSEAAHSAVAIMAASKLIDDLGLHTIEVFQTSREEIIGRQAHEIAELSTPVVKLWDGILALPLIGTLDSSRTSTVMENLLQAIVDEEAVIAIIDITGVPTVDTLVAQHLLKTIAAARLMGADCIISGIRPQIAQTMVHLGVELNVVSKATLADAFKLALKRTGRTVVAARRGRSGMDRIPILRIGNALIVTIQVDMHDRLALALEEDLTSTIVATSARGVLIEISALEIVDSFIGRMLDTIAAVSRVLDAETVVVGMRPAVAITLVELGLRLDGIKTALNVERGLALLRDGADLDLGMRSFHVGRVE